MKSGGTVPKASLSLGHQQQLLVKLPPSESQRKRHIDPALLDFKPSLSARHAQLWLPRKCKPLLCVAFWTPPAALPKSQNQQHPLQGAHHARGSKDVLLASLLAPGLLPTPSQHGARRQKSCQRNPHRAALSTTFLLYNGNLNPKYWISRHALKP